MEEEKYIPKAFCGGLVDYKNTKTQTKGLKNLRRWGAISCMFTLPWDLVCTCPPLLCMRPAHVVRTIVSAPIHVLWRPECYWDAIICMKDSGNLRKRSGAVSCILTLRWLMRYIFSPPRTECAPDVIRTIIHAPHIVSFWSERSSATQLCHL